ncbi:hypothetical protein [Geodermatophilus sp. SYSU D01176]
MSRSRGAPLRRGALVVALVTASVAGYAGAAAVSALAFPAVAVASDSGPGDGLTGYVLTTDEGVAPAGLVHAVTPADGVVNAQPVGADRVLVATDGPAGAGGSPPADVRTGPGGLRLVRSAVFSGLRAVWSTDCSGTCRGIRI